MTVTGAAMRWWLWVVVAVGILALLALALRRTKA